ncbi:MAG: DNA polymerase-3 subunit gamma/tau [Paraglaciecola sp.]|jgi:DNA polymerase-3 subunit gamma/tau
MSYQVLARKWRPNKFSELVGQEHIVTAISNALDNNRLHHAYLFSGTRGVGKTTIARIFSKSLNCEQGMSAEPCGQCGTCQEIEQGNFVDLLEIDAASRTKVEDTRELLDNVQYKPTRGRYKVYLIDEVHMLSKHSFNALLKTLEEPPPHVKFLLATTDPQKLPVTILSRCLQFNLKALSRTQISQQLQHILSQEDISHEPEALAQLARAAQGSMRDALSLSDQAIAQGNGQVSLAIVTDMLGLMDKNQVLKLLNAVLHKDSKGAMQQVEQMSFQAPDYAQVLAELMSLLHQIALTQFVPDACKLETISARAIFQLAKTITPEQIQLMYQIALQGKKDIAYAADSRTGLEMTLLRMLAFSPSSTPLSVDEIAQQGVSQNNIQVAPKELGNRQKPENIPVEIAPIVAELPYVQQGNPKEPEDMQQSGTNPKTINSGVELSQQPMIMGQESHVDSAAAFYPDQMHTDFAPQQEHYNPADFSTSESQLHASNSDAKVATQTQEQLGAVSLNSTESLLALKQKLLDNQADAEQQESLVKKSVSKSDDSWIQNKFKRPVSSNSDEIEQSSIPESGSDIQVGQDFSEQHVIEPKSEPENSAPPWEFDSTQDMPTEQLAAQNPDIKVETTTSFDPNSHLELSAECNVDFEVPIFLADGQKVIAAQQLDSWSQLIERMQVTALTKQLALHSSYAKQDNKVILTLLESKQHLNTDSAKQQLQQALSQVLMQDITLQVLLDNPINTPFAVQQNINQVRLGYAKNVVQTDQSFGLLRESFAAQVQEDSVKPR